MADVFQKEHRSWIMSRIRGTNTKPEMTVRKLLFSLGFRYRLHYAKLPGKPDIVLPRFKKAIFVHGCFWHGHRECKRSKLPSSNVEFWHTKIGRNVERDRKNIGELTKLGWQVLAIWSCETKQSELLEQKLREFLESPNSGKK